MLVVWQVTWVEENNCCFSGLMVKKYWSDWYGWIWHEDGGSLQEDDCSVKYVLLIDGEKTQKMMNKESNSLKAEEKKLGY